MTAHDHRTTIKRLFNNVWNGRRLDLVEDLYAPDFIADYRPYAPLRRGHSAVRAGLRVIRLHDLRHTHGTLLIASGVPVKVVSERLGHATPVFTIDTYQHVLPGMHANAARVFEQLIVGELLPGDEQSEKTREKRRKKTA